MSTGWTLLLAVGVIIAVVAAFWRRRTDTAELGTVSAQWIAEHRARNGHSAGR